MKQEMEYIYEVYRKGSFSKAAKALYVSQPTLSIAVRKVESDIGMPLFHREQKTLTLTDAGRIYIQKVKEILHLEDELSKELQDLSQLQTGHLTLGGTHYINSYILPPVLKRYQEKWPGIQLQLEENDSYTLLEHLMDNHIDLTFTCTSTDEAHFQRVPAFSDQIILAVPAGLKENQELKCKALSAEDILQGKHRQSNCPSISLKSLETMPFLLLTKGNNLRTRVMAMFQDAHVTPQIRMEVSQLVTSYHLAVSGMGAAFISDRLVTGPQPDMVYYVICHSLAIRQFDAVYSKNNYLSKPEKAFLDEMRLFYQ